MKKYIGLHLFASLIISFSAIAEATTFINNKNIAEDHNKNIEVLRQPYFKELASLRKDKQDISNEIKEFSNTEEITLKEIRKAKYDFYKNKNWNPPKIASYSLQNFGIWDSPFLWYTLENYNDTQNALFFYHHRNNPGIELFKKEVRRYSNIDSRYQNYLYRIEQEKFMEDTKKDYIPRNASVPVALFEDALHYNRDYKEDTLRIGTLKGENESSSKLCNEWKNSNYLSLNVSCTDREAHDDKIKDFIYAQTDGVILNSDIFHSLLKDNSVFQGFQGVKVSEEVFFMVAHKDSNVLRLDDLKKFDSEVTVFSTQTERSLEVLSNKLPEFKDVFSNIKNAPSSDHYVKKYLDSNTPVIFITCPLDNCPELETINKEYHSEYEMIPVNFWQILKDKDPMGNPIYTQTSIPYIYENIQNPDIYNKNNIRHLTFHTYFIINDYWFDYHEDNIRELEDFLREL